MILYKKDFTQEKYDELIASMTEKGTIIVDQGDYYETVKCVKSLEQLKFEKYDELKKIRDEYKKTLIVKEGVTYWDCDAQNNVYRFSNLMNMLGGFTREEKDIFISYTDEIITTYDTFDVQIKLCGTIEELENINIVF